MRAIFLVMMEYAFPTNIDRVVSWIRFKKTKRSEFFFKPFHEVLLDLGYLNDTPISCNLVFWVQSGGICIDCIVCIIYGFALVSYQLSSFRAMYLDTLVLLKIDI